MNRYQIAMRKPLVTDPNTTHTKVFTLGSGELRKLDKWITKHDKSCSYISSGHTPFDVSEPRLMYTFTPINGMCVCTVKCICGKSVCLTSA